MCIIYYFFVVIWIIYSNIKYYKYIFTQVYQTFQAKLWLSFTVLNVWMSIHQNHLVIIILMEPILELVFHICCLWYIQNTDRQGLVINLCLGMCCNYLYNLLCIIMMISLINIIYIFC